jgi:hypothetical protein
MYNVCENIFLSTKDLQRYEIMEVEQYIIFYDSLIRMRIREFFKNDLQVTNCKIVHIYAFKLIICIIYIFCMNAIMNQPLQLIPIIVELLYCL